MGKIKTLSAIIGNVSRLRKKGKTIGLITGCFDILHDGHIDLFEYAKRHCDVVVVGIENDASIKLTKGKSRPFNSYTQRAKVLSALVQVDFIFQIKQTYSFSSDKASETHRKIYNN
jgi:D-beta-D-heptose 7-phosphate kinase/D-beta-D-heptose 1-phosphate adenosyltransferase